MNCKSARGVKLRTVAFKATAVNDDGTFEGYGSVFGVVDSYNEIVLPGAFTESLKAIDQSGRTLPALWNHNSSEPIGGYTMLAEDSKGLRVEGFLLKDDVQRGREVHALMKRGVISGLSIGYYVDASSYDEQTGLRSLSKLDLVEVSPVTFPANDDARVDAVKMKLAHKTLPTIREFEALLREHGFSKSQAARIADGGFKQLENLGDPGDGEVSALAEFRKYATGFSISQ